MIAAAAAAALGTAAAAAPALFFRPRPREHHCAPLCFQPVVVAILHELELSMAAANLGPPKILFRGFVVCCDKRTLRQEGSPELSRLADDNLALKA